MFRDWLGKRRNRQSRPSGCAARRSQTARLQVETLEARCLLTLSTAAVSISAVEGAANNSILVATATDSDATVTASNLTATINWGDGTAQTAGAITQTGPNAFAINGSHVFPEESGSVVPPGAFTVTVTVQDTKNNLSSQALDTASVLDAPLHQGNPVTAGTPMQFSGTGKTNATAALNSFEAAIGGTNNVGNAAQTSGFRTINWDAVKLDGTDFGGGANSTVISSGNAVGIPLNRFQSRGVFFGAIYAVSGNGFTTVNTSATGLFPAFSPNNTFAMFNDNGIDFKFVVPSGGVNNSTIVSAASRGFGAIFINVEVPNSTSIEYFHNGTSLGKIFAPISTKGQPEFVGQLFSSPIVTNVVLTLGTDVIFRFDGTNFSANTTDNPIGGHNLVVTDDWAYAEPVAIANGFPIVSGGQGTGNGLPSLTTTVNTPFTGVVATFSDEDPNANAKDYTATINWGDGHQTNGTITANSSGGFDVSGTNTYTQLGVFPINVDIMDFGGGPGAGGSNPTLSVNNTVNVNAGDANHRYVAQLYQDLLGRNVDPSGLAFFGGLLDAGTQTRTQVVQAIQNSQERLIVVVNGTFQRLLKRPADAVGLNAFVTFLANGGTAPQLEAVLLGSDEYFQNRGGGTNNGYLSTLFQDILGRAIDSTGQTTFSQQLTNNVSRTMVAGEVLTSLEAEQDVVMSFYQRFLRRPADTGGLNIFTMALQQGAKEGDIILDLVISDEYFARV
jgi:hypothetical protein